MRPSVKEIMKVLFTACALTAAALVAGCGGGDDSNPYAENVKLKVGQTRVLDAANLTMAMTKFVDSRCPRNTQCASAGSAVIDVAVSAKGFASTTLQMTLTPGAANPTYTYGPYRMEFVDLVPYPESPVLTITDSEATVVVRRD